METKNKKNTAKVLDSSLCGTHKQYLLGCKCKPCKAARDEYLKAYREEGTLGTRTEKKLPIGPLVDFLGDDFDYEAVAQVIGVNKDTIKDWKSKKDKKIDKFVADTYATRLGVHPSFIWGDVWYKMPFFLTKEEQRNILGE